MSNYEIKIVPLSASNGGGYVAIVPTLSGCMSDGETVEEALANALIAISDWIEEAQRLNRPVPEPDIPLQEYAFG